MVYTKRNKDEELFNIMYDIASITLTMYNAKSFYDKKVYNWLIKAFGYEKTEWFLYNYYGID